MAIRAQKRKTLLTLTVLGIFLWRLAPCFVPGWQVASSRSPSQQALADGSAEVLPAQPEALEANFLESEGLWKSVSMFNAMMWGGSIVSSKAGIDALASAGVEEPGCLFGALRFLVATLCLSPWLFASSSLESMFGSMQVGTCYGAAYMAMFLAMGLGTSAAKTSFFGSLQAVVCAGITCFVARQFKIGTLAAAALAVAGVGILEFAGCGTVELVSGDLICSLVPLCFGAGWFILGQTMKKFPQDTLPSTALQLAMTALGCTGWTLASSFLKGGVDGLEQLLSDLPQVLQAPGLMPSLLFSALIGNVLTMWLANEALRRVKGSDVALLAASEPLWAAVAAMLFLGDVMQPNEMLGGALLIAAVVCNELWVESEVEIEPSSILEFPKDAKPRALVQMAALKPHPKVLHKVSERA